MRKFVKACFQIKTNMVAQGQYSLVFELSDTKISCLEMLQKEMLNNTTIWQVVEERENKL